MHVTKHRLRWPGNRKNVPGVARSVDEAVVHLSCWFFMVNRIYVGKLKRIRGKNITNLKTTRFPIAKFFFTQL